MYSEAMLTIAIPTYNRPNELTGSLDILAKQYNSLSYEKQQKITFIVSDNASNIANYNINELIDKYKNLPIKLIRQEKNIGPTNNFEYCYNVADSDYIWILADDDYLIDGSLIDILSTLEVELPDLIFLPFHPTGFSSGGKYVIHFDRNDLLKQLGVEPTLISSIILKKALLCNITQRYLWTNMHHYNYFLYVLCEGGKFISMNNQVLYCAIANNSGGYNWFEVFGTQLFIIIDNYRCSKISRSTIKNLKKLLLRERIIPTYFNFKVNNLILDKFKNESVGKIFWLTSKCYYKFPLFWIVFIPIVVLPKSVLKFLKCIYLFQNKRFFKWHI